MSRGQLTRTELDVLRFVRTRAARTDEIAASVLDLPQTNFGRRTTRDAWRVLDGLRRDGLVEPVGRWRRSWRLTGRGREAIADALLGLPEEPRQGRG